MKEGMIDWVGLSLPELRVRYAEAIELLADIQMQCLFDDDDGVGVSEDVVIPTEMFNRMCDALYDAKNSPSQAIRQHSQKGRDTE